MIDELKPCPFCGAPGNAQMMLPINGLWEVGCENMCVAFNHCTSKDAAIRLWNRRVPAPQGAPVVPVEVDDTMRRLLHAEREAIEEYGYPELRQEILCAHIDEAIAWLNSLIPQEDSSDDD